MSALSRVWSEVPNNLKGHVSRYVTHHLSHDVVHKYLLHDVSRPSTTHARHSTNVGAHPFRPAILDPSISIALPISLALRSRLTNSPYKPTQLPIWEVVSSGKNPSSTTQRRHVRGAPHCQRCGTWRPAVREGLVLRERKGEGERESCVNYQGWVVMRSADVGVS